MPFRFRGHEHCHAVLVPDPSVAPTVESGQVFDRTRDQRKWLYNGELRGAEDRRVWLNEEGVPPQLD
jgi:hypothetical protein